MMKVTPELVDSWEVGRVLPAASFIEELTVVGKEEGEIQLARTISPENRKNDVMFVVCSYRLDNLFTSDTGGIIESITPFRFVTGITRKEYFREIKPTNQLNERYLEALAKVA